MKNQKTVCCLYRTEHMLSADRLGRIPGECSFAAAFFERHGVEVWETADGHIGAYVREW